MKAVMHINKYAEKEREREKCEVPVEIERNKEHREFAYY